MSLVHRNLDFLFFIYRIFDNNMDILGLMNLGDVWYINVLARYMVQPGFLVLFIALQHFPLCIDHNRRSISQTIQICLFHIKYQLNYHNNLPNRYLNVT